MTKLPFEELMEQPVTTVGRKEEKLSQVPAAIEVITQEDIRRAGALTIPEALRWAPGLDVARIDGHRYAISSRGFNDEFANKLLVLMDGRSIYTPIFGGVYWDQQHTLMEDIERIEVIRGPGGTLWGQNAVNGIINIITKSARDTQGALLSGATGTEQHWYASGRYGGQVGTNFFYRVYGTSFSQDNLAGGDGGNGWRNNQGGFRADWEASAENQFTFQGDYYQGDAEERISVLTRPSPNTLALVMRDNAIEYSGGNLLGRWMHNWQNDSQSRLQLYYDYTERSDEAWTIGITQHAFDVDFDHRFKLGERQEIVAGVGSRVTMDTKEAVIPSVFVPESRTLKNFSGFVQDEIQLIQDRLSFIAGTKVEHNSYTRWEVQPSGRLVWSITDRQTAWAAVTRAVRTPTRTDHDVRSTVAPTGLISPQVFAQVMGNPLIESEKLNAYELGYRIQPVKRLGFDLAVFYNDYDQLVSYELESVDLTTTPPVATFMAENTLFGETYGGEIAARWEVTDWWRLRPSYTLLEIDLQSRGSSSTSVTPQSAGTSPEQQFALRSQMDLPYHFELDAGVRYVDRLENLFIDSYTALEVRLGWRPTKNLEISIAAQNLLDPRHAEFRALNAAEEVAEVERSVYGKVTWRF